MQDMLPSPRTVADWLGPVATGADPLPALQRARAAALASQPLGLWIHICPAAAWGGQLSQLSQRLAKPPTAALCCKAIRFAEPVLPRQLERRTVQRPGPHRRGAGDLRALEPGALPGRGAALGWRRCAWA